MPDDTPPSSHGIPIRKVAELTGINPVTLRAWERRYGLIKPLRTPKGHRLYGPEHIVLIERILTLVQQGVSIGQVKRMLDPGDVREPLAAPTAEAAQDPWEAYRQRMHRAIVAFDEPALDAAYNDCLALYPVDLAATRLLLPLLHALSDRGGRGVEGAFYRTYLRNKLGARFYHQNAQSRGPRILGAALAGGTPPLALLLFSLSALPRGYRFLLLDRIGDPSGLADAAVRSEAAAILLFCDETRDRSAEIDALRSLASATTVPLFIAGRSARTLSQTLRSAGALPLEDDIAEALRRIDRRLRGIA